jgi:hypothetical protein
LIASLTKHARGTRACSERNFAIAPLSPARNNPAQPGDTFARFHHEAADGSLRQPCSAHPRDGGNGLRAQASPLQETCSRHWEADMENFLLFVLSSSFCTLVAGITLLLRPLLGLP